MDKDTKDRLDHGERIIEILKQPQNTPIPFENMIIDFFAASNRFFQDIRVEDVNGYERKLIDYFVENHKDIMDELSTNRDISDELSEKIKKALEVFKEKVKPNN